jgi:hypothetical protein
MREIDDNLSDEDLERAREGKRLVAAAVAETHAPQSLREAIERDRARAARPRMPSARRRLRILVAGVGTAAIVGAIAIALESGTDGAREPSLASVDGAARLEASRPAPESTGGTPPVLDEKVGALTFPDWEKKFGWRAVGAREDKLSGRTVRTVFYRNPKGARLGYAVVAGKALTARPSGRAVSRAGRTYHVSSGATRTVVTWTQQGHTCVIVAARSVPESRLVDLAASRNS